MPEDYTDDLPEFMMTSFFTRATKACFFEAMLAGYASGVEKGAIPEMPGSKAIEWTNDRNGNWRVLDTYIVTPFSAYSGGTTLIWLNDIPVWMMQYLGHYPKEAIPCLRAALRTAYEAEEFFGGRGPEIFTHKGYTYVNNVRVNDFFMDARGEEMIFGPDGSIIGKHSYQSTFLVDYHRRPSARR